MNRGGRLLTALLLFILASAIFLLRTGTPAIFDDSDGMYAEVPREMVVTGDWLTPHADGVRYLEKPPLLYWLTAVAYRLGGVNEITARLPVALASVATVWLCFLIGELCFGLTAGLWAGVVMATAPGYFLFSRQIMPDTLFTAVMALAFYAFLRGYTALSRDSVAARPFRWYLLFYVCLGLAVLAKGLIGLVFPALTVGTFLAVNRELPRWREMRPALGALVVLAVAAPWHVAVGLRNPGFFWFYFINEHVLRFLGRRVPRDYGTVPLLGFWGLHAVWFFPWSFLLPLARRAGFHESSSAVAGRLAWFPLAWAGSVLIFFSFSTRLEYYSMPAYPAIATLIGATISGLLHAKRRSGATVSDGRPHAKRQPGLVGACAGMFVVGCLALVGMFALLALAQPRTGPRLPLIDPDSPYSVFFFSPILYLSPESLRTILVPAVGVATSLFAGTLLALLFSARFSPRPALLVLAVASVAILPWLHRCTAVFEEDFSSRSLGRVIGRHAGRDDLVVVDGQFELHSSLAFYTGRPIAVREGKQGYLEYGSRYPDCPPLFLTDAQFRRLWHTGAHVFYVARQGRPLPDDGATCRRLAISDNQVLVENSPWPREARSTHRRDPPRDRGAGVASRAAQGRRGTVERRARRGETLGAAAQGGGQPGVLQQDPAGRGLGSLARGRDQELRRGAILLELAQGHAQGLLDERQTGGRPDSLTQTPAAGRASGLEPAAARENRFRGQACRFAERLGPSQLPKLGEGRLGVPNRAGDGLREGLLSQRLAARRARQLSQVLADHRTERPERCTQSRPQPAAQVRRDARREPFDHRDGRIGAGCQRVREARRHPSQRGEREHQVRAIGVAYQSDRIERARQRHRGEVVHRHERQPGLLS
jgi:4-amino-4-deoxy-L-arabinose transferase-like glycosyltransferase